MPRGDRTGPLGRGPQTGRAAGFCAGFGAPGCANPTPGYGFGRRWAGFGRGRGLGLGRGFGPFFAWKYGYYGAQQPDREVEKERLVNETKFLKEQLFLLEKRLADLKGEE